MTRENVKTFDDEDGLVIMVPDSMKVECDNSVDDLVNVLIGTISRNINPCSLAMNKIQIDTDGGIACSRRGTRIEIATRNHCPFSIRNLVLAIASVMNRYDKFGDAEVTLYGLTLNVQTVHKDLTWAQECKSKCRMSSN